MLDNVAAIAGVNPVPLELEAVLNIDGSKDPLLGPPGFDILSLDKSVTSPISDTTKRERNEVDHRSRIIVLLSHHNYTLQTL